MSKLLNLGIKLPTPFGRDCFVLLPAQKFLAMTVELGVDSNDLLYEVALIIIGGLA